MTEIQENISSYTKYHKASYLRHQERLCNKQAAYYENNNGNVERNMQNKKLKNKEKN